MKKADKSSSVGTAVESSSNADVSSVSQPIAKPSVIGSGMNKSKLTEEQCLGILINCDVAFESLDNDDLDSLYKVATKHWAYHLTRKGYIDRLYKFRLENAVCQPLAITIDFTTASPINVEKLSKQNRLIYNHLVAGKTITVYDAIGMGIFHLHSRAAELRRILKQNGANLYDRTITENNTTCKEYSLTPLTPQRA